MTRTVYCMKMHQQLEGLANPPYPGELGNRIFENISKQAWNMWLRHQTMLINEYRLNLGDANARQFLLQEMEKFFFGEGSEKPPAYKPVEDNP